MFSLFISVLTLIIQYYLQIRLVKSQRSFEIMGKLNECNLAELSFPAIWDFYNTEDMNEDKGNHEFTKLVDMKISLWEEIFMQCKKYKFSNKKDWIVGRKVLEKIVVKPFFPGYWTLFSPYFHEAFNAEVSKLCSEMNNNLKINKEMTSAPASTTANSRPVSPTDGNY